MEAAITEIKILISMLIERIENEEDIYKKQNLKYKLQYARTALTSLTKAIE